MSLVVWAVDPSRVKRGHLAVTGCSVVVRDADVGTFQVTARLDDLAALVGDGWRVVIQDGQETILSGPITSRAPDLLGGVIVFDGESDLVHVRDKIVFPNPSAAGDAQTADAYYKRSGPVETVVRNMIHENAGAGIHSSRTRYGGFTVAASQGRGSTVTTNLRYKNLLEESRALARLGGVTFDAVQEESSDIVLRFRVPVDRSRSVRFAERNDGVTDASFSLAAPTATTVFVAGQGQGTARNVIARSRATTWGRSIEVFKDQRDTDDAAELEQSAVEQLDEGEAGAGAQFSVTEAPGLVYGTDYALGDTVSVEAGRVTISEPVRAVELSWDGHGREATLTLGDHDEADDKTPAWVKRIKKLDARLRSLEVR